MFIELTDILRCPESHDEQFLILLPEEMSGRSVRTGQLGCPVCHAEFRIEQGVVGLSRGALPAADAGDVDPLVDAAAIAAFLGLGGPGGYLGLVGNVPGIGGELVGALPGVHLVAINPPAGTAELPMMSVLTSSILPIKSRSLRGVVLGSPFGGDPFWMSEGVRVLLPGLRVVGRGAAPAREDLNVLAAAGGWWVAAKT